MKNNENIREFPKGGAKKPKGSSKSKALWIGSVIVLVLAAASFIFLPAQGSRSGGGKNEPFGYYNNKPIEYTANSRFTRMLEQQQEQMRNQQIDSSAAYELFDRAFRMTVIYEALSYAVDKSGYIVPENAIDRQMIPYFYDERGVYSARLFHNTSDAGKIALRKSISESLIQTRYTDDLFGSNSEMIAGKQLYGKKTSSKESDFLAALGQKERAFELAAFNISNYPEEEAGKFAQSHSDLFTRYNLSVITVNTEDEAKSVLRQITNNEIIFEDAIKDISLKFYSGEDGKLTSPYQYVLKNIASSDENFSAITSLEQGNLSGVIKTANGYSIFRCDAPQEIPDFNDSAVKAIVLNYIRSYERVYIEDYFSNIANDFATVALQSDFAEACAEFGASRIEVPSFPINYGSSELFAITPAITELSGADRNERFLQTAFSLNEGEISSPIVLGDNILVLKMTSQVIKEEDENTTVFLIPYYTNLFDQNAVQNAVFSDTRLKNNFMNVYFRNYSGF